MAQKLLKAGGKRKVAAKRHRFAAEFIGIQSKDELLAANPTYAKKVGIIGESLNSQRQER